MNKTISITGSVILTLMTGIFFLCQLINAFYTFNFLNDVSFFLCIFLSWGYLLCVLGHSFLSQKSQQIAVDAAKVFAIIYSVFVSIVYFTQLSVVHYHVLSKDIVNALSMNYPGSWLFVIDIAGYGIMALSTLLLGLSIKPVTKTEKMLKLFSLIHGIFIVAIFMPLTDWFLKESTESSLNIGCLSLAIWCLIFIPIPIFSYMRFKETDFTK